MEGEQGSFFEECWGQAVQGVHFEMVSRRWLCAVSRIYAFIN